MSRTLSFRLASPWRKAAAGDIRIFVVTRHVQKCLQLLVIYKLLLNTKKSNIVRKRLNLYFVW